MNSPIEPSVLMFAQTSPAPVITLWSYIVAGGAIGYVLIALSFLALGLIIANIIQLRLVRLAPPAVAEHLSALLQSRDVEGAVKYCREQPVVLAEVVGRALERCRGSSLGFLELRDALEEATQQRFDRLQRITDGIGIIAGVGPMLGLLGTVAGMIGAFRTIGALEGAARSSELAGYMSLALVATAQGLIVAIPCTIAYTLFRRRLDHLSDEIGQISGDLTQPLQNAAAGGAAA